MVYFIVEKFSMLVVGITIVGMAAALVQPKVLAVSDIFLKSLFIPHAFIPPNWDPKDTSILVTSIAYAGAGGFGQLFLGYYMRDKSIGMAKYIGRVTSPITGELEPIPATGYAFKDTPENKLQYKGWVKYFSFENFIGVFLNTVTTVVMCWLAWAVLLPEHKVPKGWEIAVVQSAFFEVAWGAVGKALFLVVAAAFLCDAWLQHADGFSRVQSDYFYANFKFARKLPFRTWYYMFLTLFTVMTTITMALAQPGTLIVIRGVISFLAMSIFSPGLIYLNYYMMPKVFPKWTKPHPITQVLMYFCTAAYIVMACIYLSLLFRGKI